MSKKIISQLKSQWPILVIFLLGVFFRLFFISNNKIYFWYDQARDAFVSRQIFEQTDFKIQGPSASGTNDTLYHGVLYYYLIGPIYYLSHGNPWPVAATLGVVNSLAIIVFYWLIWTVFKQKKLALLAAGLLAISFEHTSYSTWLSNPAISLVPILVFYLLIWKVFFQKQLNFINSIILGFWMGIIQQSAIFLVYHLGSIVVASIYNNARTIRAYLFLNSKYLIAFLAVFLLSISSMLINQYKLYAAGIFSLTSISGAIDEKKAGILSIAGGIWHTFTNKGVETLFPSLGVMAMLGFLAVTTYALLLLTKKQRVFLLSWYLAPFWLYLIQFRESVHTIVGQEYLIIIFFAVAVYQLWQNQRSWKKILALLLISLYGISQIFTVLTFRQNNNTIFTYQKNVLLINELKVIDATYQSADHQPFSFSLWVTPYQYYITWAYLYDWYGKPKYGYSPTYVGSNQKGRVGETLLLQRNDPVDKIHFLILEPNIQLVGNIYTDFITGQENMALLQNKHYFGSYELWQMSGKSN